MKFDIIFEYEESNLEVTIRQSGFTKMYILKIKSRGKEVYKERFVLVEDAIKIVLDFLNYIFI